MNYDCNIKSIFLKNYEKWCMLALGYLKNRAEAEDVVQEVWLKILYDDKIESIENLESYVFTAVKNTSIKKYKSKNKLEPISTVQERLKSKSPSFETQVLRMEISDEVRQAVEKLPNQCRQVFGLCAEDGLKYKEAAENLGISRNTVKSHMKNAYKILRMHLSDVYFMILLFSEFIISL